MNDPGRERQDRRGGSVRTRPTTRYAVAGVLIALVLSVAANVVLLASRAPTNERLVADSHVWAGLNATSRPKLIVIGDHFFFGEWGSRLRTRDIRNNSKDDLQAAAEYAANPGLSFETLSYLPKSTLRSANAAAARGRLRQKRDHEAELRAHGR